jgi:hypothetical protein
MIKFWVFLVGIGIGMAIWAALPKVSERIFSWMDETVIVVAPEDKAEEIEQCLWGQGR